MKRILQFALVLVLMAQISGGAQVLPLLDCPLFEGDGCCPESKPARCPGESCWSAPKQAPTPGDVPAFAVVVPDVGVAGKILRVMESPRRLDTPWLQGRDTYLRTRVLLI